MIGWYPPESTVLTNGRLENLRGESMCQRMLYDASIENKWNSLTKPPAGNFSVVRGSLYTCDNIVSSLE